jgi:sensor histidine kinase regulating citrate/malate metabolism
MASNKNNVKIFSIVTTFLILQWVIVSALVSSQMKHAMLREYLSKSKGIVRAVAVSTETFLSEEGRIPELQSLINEFKVIEGVSYIAITNTAGEVISHTIVPAFPDVLKKVITAYHDEPNPSSPSSGSGESKEYLKTEEENERASGPDAAALAAQSDIVMEEVEIRGVPNIHKVLNFSKPILSGALGIAHVGMNLNLIEDKISHLSSAVALVFFIFLIFGIMVTRVCIKIFSKPPPSDPGRLP